MNIVILSVITARSSQHRNNHYANPHFAEFETVPYTQSMYKHSTSTTG